jgi:hypothetical protein
MNIRNLIFFALGTLALFAIPGCGGGSGGGSGGNPQDPGGPVGGIGRNGISIGSISTFGSVVVNGVRYDTAGATITVNDSVGSESDLRVGQVVTVVGTVDDDGTTGTAETVTFDDNVTGPVESIDVAGSQLVVLGQTVLVRPETSFDDSFNPASLDGISIGQIIEVSGLIDAVGSVVATRLEAKPAGTQFEVHGTVSSLDAAGMSFEINGLTVDFSSATLEDFPTGQISAGDFVEAKGSTLGANDELLASSVELESLVPGFDDGDRIEIEGFITRFASSQDFDVAGLPVTTTGSTVFEGGSAADLGLNVKVEAEGDINASGVLVAGKIDIRRSKAVRMTASADSVDAANNSVVVLGISVAVDALTRLEDKSSADVDPLTLAAVNVGDYLEIRGTEMPAGSGSVLATIFEREDPRAEAILQGFVESVSGSSFGILGVTISTNGATVYRDADNTVISANQFFNQLTTNSLVKAEGTEISDTAILATEVEFELEF